MVRGISPVGKEKVYGGKKFAEVLSSEWNTERVREMQAMIMKMMNIGEI